MNGTHFVSYVGLELETVEADRAVGNLVVGPHHMQPYGIVHGGVCCTMVETLASLGGATWALQQGMFGCVGVSNQTDFLRPIRQGTLRGEATPLHQGRTQQLWQVIITRDDDKVAARGQLRLHNVTDPASLG